MENFLLVNLPVLGLPDAMAVPDNSPVVPKMQKVNIATEHFLLSSSWKHQCVPKALVSFLKTICDNGKQTILQHFISQVSLGWMCCYWVSPFTMQ